MVTTEHVEERLVSNGYRAVRTTPGHVLYEHDGDRIVVPRHSTELSPWSARVIEWTLEPRLGTRWLSEPSGVRSPTGPDPHVSTRKRLTLDLVIRAEPDRSSWNAFVVQEPRILTFGPTLVEVRRHAGDAAETWYGDAASVELRARLQPDHETQRWLETANASDGSDGVEAARHQLARLGYAEEDVDALIRLADPDTFGDVALDQQLLSDRP